MLSLNYSKNSGAQSASTMSSTLLHNTRIAIATSHGRYYYRFAKSLRALGMRFDSIVPNSVSVYDGDIILYTQ